MSGQCPFLFNYGEENKLIMYNRDSQIEALLNDFLRQTNSIMNLDFKQITFMHHNIILNKPDNLHKKISEIIKTNTKKNLNIKVIDTNGIIGGLLSK